MELKIALLWDKDTPFKQYLTDSGFDCQVLTPQLLAAPFFSWRSCRLVIVPAGFGHAFYSGVLKDLRANSAFINTFVKAGGTLLVSGALSERDAYNWLPWGIKYLREERTVKIERVNEHKATAIIEKDECMCDGYFEKIEGDWDTILAAKGDTGGKAILVAAEYGAGTIIATTIHEYPSERFIASCMGK
jgi:hypothetical protein